MKTLFLTGSHRAYSSIANETLCSLSDTSPGSPTTVSQMSHITHDTLISYVKQDLIKPHVVRFILSQSSSEVVSRFFSNRRVSSRFDIVNASITSHLHILKLFMPLNFTTPIFNGCGFMHFTVDVLSSAIFSIDSSKTMQKANGVR